MKYHILHIEDSATDADLVKRVLQRSGLDFTYYLASDKAEVTEALDMFEPNVVLCDHSLPSFNSKMAYVLCNEKNPNLAFILVTGSVSEEFAVDMIKTGIDDYLLKTNLQRLPVAISNAFYRRENDKKVQVIRNSLQQSETHLRTIFENSSVGLLLLDRNCTILELNDRTKFYNTISFGRELVKNESLLESLPPYRREEMRLKFEKCLQGEAIHYESVYPQPDGTIVTFDVKLDPTINKDGTVTGVCMTFEDISNRKQAELRIRESEVFNRSILTSIDDHIAVVEANGDIISVNKAWNDFSVENGESVLHRTGVGSNYKAVCEKAATAGEPLAAKALEGFRRVLKRELPFFEMEYPCHSADEQRWYLLRVVNFADDSPKLVMMHINISELKKADEETTNLTKRLQLATTSAGMGIWEWNVTSNRLIWDEGMYRLYNIDGKLFGSVYHEWLNRLHPDDLDRVKEEVQKAVRGEKMYDTEFRIMRDDGSVRYIKATGLIENDASGNAARMIGVNLDITEQKESENALIESENRLRTILHAEPECVNLLDKNGCLQEMNPAGLAMLEADNLEQLLGRPVCTVIKEPYRKRYNRLIHDVFEGHSGLLEFEITGLKGTHRWLETHAVPLRNTDGDIISMLGVTRDISERKIAETQKQKAYERYDILARATSDTIWDWDIPNDQMLFNQGISTMLGYEASVVESVVDWWTDKLHSEDYQQVSDVLRDAFKTKTERIQLSYRFRCRDGSYKHIFDRAFIIFENGVASRMIGAMQDITYQVEEELRIDKAIIDAQEKERQYLGAELHDNINQILTGASLILGMAKPTDMDAEQRTGFIISAMGHIKDAIEETRQLSHRFAPAVIDENSLRDLFESLLATINPENRFVTTLVFDGVDEAVMPDDIQINLYRILQEQTKNILKYAEAKNIDVRVTVANDTVAMLIVDDGKGFDTRAKKAGIGLSNIKKRAESLSGKFLLMSAPGKGCKIEVQLPLASHIAGR